MKKKSVQKKKNAQTSNLDLLARIFKMAGSSLDLDKLLKKALKLTAEQMNVKAATIMLLEDRNLTVRASYGVRLKTVLHCRPFQNVRRMRKRVSRQWKLGQQTRGCRLRLTR